MSFTSASTAPAGTGERWVDVYLSAAARAVSTCGDFLAATALVLALQARGAGGYAVAAILLAAAVPPVVLAPLTGRLVDRVDSRVLLVAAGLGQAVVCAALAYTTSTVLIVVLAALLAAGLAVTQPTLSALLPAMVNRAGLPKAAAIGQTATSLGGLLAPVLGGLLFGAFGPRVPLLLDAASFLAIALLGLVLRTRRNAGPAAPSALPVSAPGESAAQPVWRLRADALLFPLMVVTGAVVAVVSAVNVIDVFFVRGELHASATVYGLIAAVWVAAMMGGAWAVAKAKLGDAGIGLGLFATLGLLCVVAASLSLVPTLGWLIPVMVIGGVLNGCFNTALGVLLGSRVPAAVRGRAYATLGAIANGANAAGYLLGGVLLAVLAVRPTLALVGIGGLLVTLVFAAPTLRAIARERAAHAAHATVPADETGAELASVS